MIELLGQLVGVLGGAVGLIAFGLGVTRTARLRRRETLFRDALNALPEDHGSHKIAKEMHRAAMAEIVARQLTSPWRVLAPWLIWVGVAAVGAQMSVVALDLLSRRQSLTYSEFASSVFGDSATPIVFVGLLVGVLPQVFLSYVFTIVGRARVARAFFDGRTVKRPETYIHNSVASRFERRRPAQQTREKVNGAWANIWAFRKPLWRFVTPIVPGLFALAVGAYGGLAFWTRRQPDLATALKDSDGLFSVMLLALPILGVMMFSVAVDLHMEVARSALPSSHPRTDLFVSRRRRR